MWFLVVLGLGADPTVRPFLSETECVTAGRAVEGHEWFCQFQAVPLAVLRAPRNDNLLIRR